MWLLLTIALLIKHIIAFQFLLMMTRITRKYFITIVLIFLSLIIFFSSFLPYWQEGKQSIILNVFRYGGIMGYYGFSNILRNVCDTGCVHSITLLYLYKYIFIFISLLFTVTLVIIRRDIIWSLMMSILFFLTFTSGIGGQYFVLPIALGALKPTKMYFLYTVVTSFFLLGNKYEFDISYFKFFSWNIIWFVAFIWFLYEIKSNICYFKGLKNKKWHKDIDQALIDVRKRCS